jgi:HAD superfamily hydrolase (TIGR01549 family)
MAKFSHDVSFEQVRSQIGKGGDKLIPMFLSEKERHEHGKELEAWRGERFKARYLPLIRPFSAVPSLLQRSRDDGLRIAVASSAKKDEVEKYLEIAGITKLVDTTVSSEDVDESKPEPDVFEAVLRMLKIDARDAVAIGDTPYDAQAARRAGIATVGVLSGGFSEESLRQFLLCAHGSPRCSGGCAKGRVERLLSLQVDLDRDPNEIRVVFGAELGLER